MVSKSPLSKEVYKVAQSSRYLKNTHLPLKPKYDQMLLMNNIKKAFTFMSMILL